MAAINPNDLSKLAGIIEVSPVDGVETWTRLPSVRGLTTTINATDIIEINADDTGTVYNVVNRSGSVTFEFLENKNRDKLSLLFGGIKTDVAGTPVAITGEVAGENLVAGTVYTLANKNGDNTQVASITVSDTGGALVLNTNYTVSIVNGETRIVFLTATTGETTVNYTYTPNESEDLELDMGAVEVKSFKVRVTSTDDAGKITRTTLTSAKLNSEYSISYQDVVTAGDITGATLTFDTNKGSKYIYHNEQI